MTFFWSLITFIVYFTHNFYTILFVSDSLSFDNIKKPIIVIFSIVNTFTIFIAHFLGLHYYSLLIPLFFVYTLEFLFISKLRFRKSIFTSTAIILNLFTINLFVLVIAATTQNLTLNQVYADDTFLYQSLLISSFILLVMQYKNSAVSSSQKFSQVANSNVYATIMSFVSIALFLFLAIDSYIIMDIIFTPALFVSSISTLCFILIMYYCLFYFNISLTQLHPFKRKADEVRKLHEKVISKKIETEFKLYTDDLTKLYNRRFIFAKLDELCASSDVEFSIMFLDLASLKYVNDNYGHKTGDQYIIDISNILRQALREEDLSARIGGDEFLVLLFDANGINLEHIVRRIKDLILIKSKEKSHIFHANIGYLTFDTTNKNQTRAELMNKVDDLMNLDKSLFYKKGGMRK